MEKPNSRGPDPTGSQPLNNPNASPVEMPASVGPRSSSVSARAMKLPSRSIHHLRPAHPVLPLRHLGTQELDDKVHDTS